jgi:hypothetical protein
MRDEPTAALQARWEESLADEATNGGDGVGEVEEGVDDFLAALVAALQPVEGVVPGVSLACQRCPAGSGRVAFLGAGSWTGRSGSSAANWSHNGSSSHDGMAGTGTPVIRKRRKLR